MLNRIFQLDIKENMNSNSIEWKMANHWSKNFFINNNQVEEIQDVFKLIINSQTVINKGNVIYVSKASEIPRFKLKEFIKENGLKKTSRYNYADVIIINKGYLNELIKEFTQCSNFTFINKDFVEKNYKDWEHKNTYRRPTVSDIVTESKDLNTVAIIDGYTSKNLNKIFKNHPIDRKIFDSNIHIKEGIVLNFYRNERLTNLLSILYELKDDIKKEKIKIIFDEDIFVELNKEGIELDDEYLKTLRDILFSSDKSNIKLGFEMMSNLVITQSMLLSVSFLLNELIHTTRFRPSYYVSSNTNLKSLLKVLKTKGIHWECDWKKFGTGLRLNFKDGKEGEIVKKFLIDNINREFKLNNSAAESLVDIVFATEA